ncbi:MAG TPA: GbsR/MarR family transcriptional regulator [Bacillales bacterium]
MSENKRLEKVNNRIIELIAENMKAYGVPATIGRVLGTVYYNRKPMTLDELSEKIGMSKTRISQVVREMIDYNIAERVFEKGARKDLYDVEQDYYQTFIFLFTSNWRKTALRNRQSEHKFMDELNEIINDEAADPEEREKAEELFEECQICLDFYDWLDRLVNFFESGEVFKSVPKTETLKEEKE